MSTLDEITKEKQRVGEALARADAQREKLAGQLGELEAAERLLVSGKVHEMLRPVRSLGVYPQHQTAISGSPGSTSAPDNVRYLAQSREHILTESFTGRDPTRTIGSRTPREGTDRSEKKPSE